MTTVDELLLKALDELKREDLKRFKWFLKKHGSISVAVLERADNTFDTVDVMVEREGPEGAVKITLDILRRMNQNHLAEQLENWTAITKKNELINPKKDEPRLNSEADKARYFDNHWPNLIQGVKNVQIIADKLCQQKLIQEEQYSEIIQSLTSQESMRKICDIIRSTHRDAVKAEFISVLQEEKLYHF